MAFICCMGGTLKCSFGTAPSSFLVLPKNMVTMPTPMATIMDYIPMVNILPFAMCTTVTNPVVASATAAACGVLTPMPCIPATVAPWLIGKPTATLNGQPILENTSKLMCMWGGVIEFIYAGQVLATI